MTKNDSPGLRTTRFLKKSNDVNDLDHLYNQVETDTETNFQ